MLFDHSINLDGCIAALVHSHRAEESLKTELVVMLLMIKDIELQEVALCSLFQALRNFEMLLELKSSDSAKLDFSIHKGQTLREVLKDNRYVSLVKKTACLLEG